MRINTFIYTLLFFFFFTLLMPHLAGSATFSLLSLLFPPFPFFSSSSIIQPWQLLLSSDPGALWPSLASLWLPGHGTACSPGPSFAHNSRCGRYCVSSEGYKDSGSTLQFSPARFTLKKNNKPVFSFFIPLRHAHLLASLLFYYRIVVVVVHTGGGQNNSNILTVQ